MGKAIDIALDGENVLLLEYNEEGVSNLKYNGKTIHNLTGLTWTNLTLKDGHRVYSMGPGPGDSLHHVYYDGKDLGFGTSRPLIEKNHLAYLKHPKNPQDPTWSKFIYDGKEIGPIGSAEASLR
jgi:hypothetical protein